MTVVCGEHPEVIGWLETHDIDVLTVRENAMLPIPTARHADMLCFSCGDGKGFTYDALLCEELKRRGYDFSIPTVPLGAAYPNDIRLNCLLIGKWLIANVPHIAPEIKEWARGNGVDIVSVRQGYARCSTLAVNGNAAITADKGIADTLRSRGIDVLQIEPGHIRLDGYEYGFIGGASAVLGDMVLFFGDPLSHPCGADIVRFIEAHGSRIETTGAHELRDLGSCVMI